MIGREGIAMRELTVLSGYPVLVSEKENGYLLSDRSRMYRYERVDCIKRISSISEDE